MSKSRLNKKELSKALRTQSVEWEDIFSLLGVSDLSLYLDRMKTLITKLGKVPLLITQSQKEVLERILSVISFISILVLNFDKLINFIRLVAVGADRLFPLDSTNSSTPPRKDENREKTPKPNKNGQKRGAQLGHPGSTLRKVENPDERIELFVDRSKLSPDDNWRPHGFETRQVFGIRLYRYVIEYIAEILINDRGETITAGFPDGVKAPTQYGQDVVGYATYMNVAQMIPFERLVQMIKNLFGYEIGFGTLSNFRTVMAQQLKNFERWAKAKIIAAENICCDETGINVNGKLHWCHIASTTKAVLLMIHEKRGYLAMVAMDILTKTKAVLSHDHWAPYFRFTQCLHSLCNAHLLRELKHLIDKFGLIWPQKLTDFLLALKKEVEQAGGVLSEYDQRKAKKDYMDILEQAGLETPEDPKPPGKKRGRQKKSKARNLLERLINDVDDVLRFATNYHAQFSNNQAENDLRMLKVKLKISGCFRGWQGANDYMIIRSYLLTCARHNIDHFEALRILASGRLPDFIDLSEIENTEPHEMAA
jgi:transposase